MSKTNVLNLEDETNMLTQNIGNKLPTEQRTQHKNGLPLQCLDCPTTDRLSSPTTLRKLLQK
jgi:hypothetical protein